MAVQHSSEEPVVPDDPPETMMDEESFLIELEGVRRFGGPGTPCTQLVDREANYSAFREARFE